uniref:Kelch-like protein 24 n=2 Tax=Ciona intestinalis TaxID=7719 RepID=A0A1W3JEL3_CIOIN|nr:kelch-like protein 24 isoform X1 [Ciona intestinalis]XP_009859379.1 kelch-like protein 24 isoform X2 [Ciona intestinalis]|eukprot:XP_009859378.1 kelch-like protein 24 isoform X1 [Ciona intestinalis]
MAHRDHNSPGSSRNIGPQNRARGLGAIPPNADGRMDFLEEPENNEEFPLQVVNRRHNQPRARAGGVRIVTYQSYRGYRLRREDQQEQQGRFYNSPPVNQDQQNDIVPVLSSPDGFSSDSLAGEEHEWSDGMSSISDLDERLPPAAAPPAYPVPGAADSPPPDFLGISMGSRGVGSSRGNKRTRTGSTSSYSSVESVCFNSRKQKISNTNSVQCISQRMALIDKLQKYRSNKEFTDVILTVEDQEIACHRVVLAANSPYFHALLSSNMKEGREGRVHIQGHKPEIVHMLVRHAYAEAIKVTTENAQDVLEAADYFQMDMLKSHCEKFLIRQVAESNCLGLMQFASLHSLDRLYNKAKKYAVKNFNKVSQQEEFLRLPLATLSKYLEDHGLVVQREEHVYDAAMRWLEYDATRKEHVAEVLRCVRLFFVSSRFLFEVITKHPMFQGNPEVQNILSEACKYHALGSNEMKHGSLPHTKPRASSGISEVLVVVGGICNNRRLLYTECYHPNKQDWISLSDISTSHATMHSYSVCSHKNDIYITGGHSNSGMTMDAVSVYFSNIDQWSLLAHMQHPRERHGSASVDGAVYVAGGLMASPKNRKKPGVLDNVERYRPDYNRWEKVKPLPKRCYSPGVLSYKEKLYVIGGVSMTEEPSNSSKIILDCIQCYDPLKDSWSQLPLGRPLARLSCALYRDHFYMISNNASSIFRYDPNTCTLEEWRELHELNVEFAGLAAFNGKLVISGGQKGSTTLNHMLVIDFESGRVEEEVKMKRSRCMHGCVPIDKFG